MSAGRGWELQPGSVMYWLLVAHRMAHTSHPLDRPEDVRRSAMRDADHRLRRSSHPYDHKVVEVLRSIEADVMRASGDQAVHRLARVEQELAIWKLSEAFAVLGAIPCKRCGAPAHEHAEWVDEGDFKGTCVRVVDRYLSGICPGHHEP